MISDKRIDRGKEFDWGRVSAAYAKYRDIYPEEFYRRIAARGLCRDGQEVLDLGTGTGVLPRNMYRYGAKFVGTDISENQIRAAAALSREAGMDISYQCSSAEDVDFPKGSFDVVTACQCFFYFKHEIVARKLFDLLKPDGKLVVLYMAWLPLEDKAAEASEELVLKYNPEWSGCGETRHPILIPEDYASFFEIESEEVYDLSIPFTRADWNGRMEACRGIGASLSEDKVSEFREEHMALLEKTVPPEFEILHYAAMTVMKVK